MSTQLLKSNYPPQVACFRRSVSKTRRNNKRRERGGEEKKRGRPGFGCVIIYSTRPDPRYQRAKANTRVEEYGQRRSKYIINSNVHALFVFRQILIRYDLNSTRNWLLASDAELKNELEAVNTTLILKVPITNITIMFAC